MRQILLVCKRFIWLKTEPSVYSRSKTKKTIMVMIGVILRSAEGGKLPVRINSLWKWKKILNKKTLC